MQVAIHTNMNGELTSSIVPGDWSFDDVVFRLGFDKHGMLLLRLVDLHADEEGKAAITALEAMMGVSGDGPDGLAQTLDRLFEKLILEGITAYRHLYEKEPE